MKSDGRKGWLYECDAWLAFPKKATAQGEECKLRQ